MNKFYAVLLVIFFVFYFAERGKRRKAERVRYATPRLRRGAIVRTAAWSIVGLTLVATVAILLLDSY